MPRIIVGVSGASGSIYAIQTLRALRAIGGFEIHLVVSPQAKQTVELETDVKPRRTGSAGRHRSRQREPRRLDLLGFVQDRRDDRGAVLDAFGFGNRLLAQR